MQSFNAPSSFNNTTFNNVGGDQINHYYSGPQTIERGIKEWRVRDAVSSPVSRTYAT